MTHALWEPSNEPLSIEPRPPKLASLAPAPRSPPVNALAARAAYDGPSFEAGEDCGTRVAAWLARLAALELVEGARLWNRRAHRRMAGALVAFAEELESAADGRSPPRAAPPPRPAGLPPCGG
jgi:hypothetical protein